MRCCHSGQTTLETNGARIYLDPETVPPHPGDHWTRFVCISDTHGRTPAVPDGDILLHAGDISANTPESVESMFEWLKGLPHETKVSVRSSVYGRRIFVSHPWSIIAGNHDVRLGTAIVQFKVVLFQLVVMFGQDVASWGSFWNKWFRQEGKRDLV